MRNINHHSKFDNMMRVHSKLYNICLYIFVCLIIVNLDIVTANAQTVVRGPYLQNGATDGVSIMWRTDTSTVGRVWYGSSLGTLHQIVDETSGEGTDHLVRLEFLTPNTKYFYQIGTDQGTVLTGGDTEHYFYTNPYIQVAQPVRIWAIGDSGTANTNAQMVRDAYIELATTEKKADLWLMLGDNAYNTGTDGEYQNAVFDMYPTILRNTILWSTQGNHDYASNSYYNVFDLPTTGEGGGLASGTEQYYSFDYANIHFICLNSEISSLSSGSNNAMYSWLQDDLLNTSQDWIIAYFHHPPYTKGSHDSDNFSDSGGKLFYMRENALPILEAGGVDLVLCGHSHSYERSFFINGHYGTSDTFYSPTHVAQSGNGKVGGDGAYMKTSTIGTVYIVGGSSGKVSGTLTQHNAMQAWLKNLGSVVIDVNGLTMNVSFLRELTGSIQIDDYFTISKLQVQSPSAPGNLTATAVSGNQINLSWSDVLDETGYKVERSEDEQNWSEIATTGRDSTTYNDTNNLQPSTNYYYQVVSYNNGDNSPPSNIASATTQTTDHTCLPVSISPASKSFGQGGGTDNVNVVAPDGCNWTASSSDPSWLQITSGGSGTGDGTVDYSVSPNTGAIARTATITITGDTLKTFKVNQAGVGASPAPDVKANGSDGPVIIGTSDTLSVTVSLTAGGGYGYGL